MKKAFRTRVVRDFQKHKFKYLIVIPIIIYLILFCYKPMYGVIIAFKKYRPSLGIAESSWVGFDNFMRFFNDPWIWRLLRNTISISFLMLLFSFPAAIFLALLLNEVKVSWFKRTVQTITYMPHFIALVVVCGLINSFCQSKEYGRIQGGAPLFILLLWRELIRNSMRQLKLMVPEEFSKCCILHFRV